MSSRGRQRGRGRARATHSNGTERRAHDEDNGQYNAHLTERFGSRAPRNHDSQTMSRPKIMADPAISQYVRKQEQIREDAVPKDWLALPEIPPASELCIEPNASISLPRNRIEQPWPTAEKYLKAHYKLLREDTVAPLRDAITRYRQDPNRMDDHEVRIYEQVRVVGLTFTFKGIASRIRFSTVRSGRKILWSANKRLTSGTLVALTPSDDGFAKRCLPAIVAARPLVNLEIDPPEIDILFADSSSHEVDPQTTYIMIEATQGYFEAYRHTLNALQKQSRERFPLSEHICQLNPDIPPPEYLVQNPHLDLTVIDTTDDVVNDNLRELDVLRDWPKNLSKTLDKTQWKALQKMLTQKLSIIQGPPGTGKTHVSNIAIRIMLKNRQPQDPPIIIACQTNHALDQLLNHIKVYEDKFIRLGGRSTDATIRKRALYEVRKTESHDELQGSAWSKARRDIATETMKCKAILSALTQSEDGEVRLLSADTLLQFKVIDKKQHESLVKGASQWVRANGVTEEPLQMWLSRQVSPYKANYNQPTFGFEEAEEDLELEQRRELDADTGLADDEDHELLKGDFISLSMGHTMPKPTAQTIEMAKRTLDTVSDLYKVPEYLRGALYLIVQEKVKVVVSIRLQECAKAYDKVTTQIQIGRWERDLLYLSKAPIIGLTTTGLSKYRALISALKPKIMLIEEAAEVLEAPVGVGCVESLQHLILVGDHQQLQASCSVLELKGDPYHLNISMFERLVRNQMPMQTLLRQRRMEPLFRELIQLPYPGLKDHPDVVTRPRTQWGMGDKICWFFKHDKHELQDESLSAYNEYEAEMVTKFYRHLTRNGVPAAAIAVLTFYNGQRKRILKLLKSDPETASTYNKVKTVDSYQGEESQIVLLSLTRSNSSGRIGFLSIDNRVIVALSRAQYGFYLFGNGDFLAEHSSLWDDVETKLFRKDLSETYIPTTCVKHGKTIKINHPNQFDLLDGGCELRCTERLSCGHPCTLNCHSSEHTWVVCEATCGKKLVCGHICSMTCKDKCSCQCEAFAVHEATSKPPDSTAAWKNMARTSLMEDNFANATRNAAHTAQPDSPAPTRQSAFQDGLQPVQISSKSVGDGRMRFVDHYEPIVGLHNDAAKEEKLDMVAKNAVVERELQEPERVSQQLKQLSVSDQAVHQDEDPLLGGSREYRANHSQRGGRAESGQVQRGRGQARQGDAPRRQPAGPAVSSQESFQSMNTRETKLNIRSDQPAPAPTANDDSQQTWDKQQETMPDIFSQWALPEDREWEIQKRKELNEMSTEFW